MIDDDAPSSAIKDGSPEVVSGGGGKGRRHRGRKDRSALVQLRSSSSTMIGAMKTEDS